MAYKTIYTTAGLTALTNAQSSGIPVNLTHMAVGDGNGNPVTPVQAQTALVRELYRHTVNRVFNDPDNPTKFTAELVVPATEGGFTLREVGIFTSAGTLFAVGNLPDTYKPADTEGAYSDTVVRMEFVVSNASVVNVFVDPNVAIATQEWITNNITAEFLLPGGTTHQILRKVSNADGDTEWADPTEVNVVVDIIEEKQTLSAAQTVVTLATTTTTGLVVYIEGVRLNRGAGTDEWNPDPSLPATRIILGQSYPATTKILCVQNTPLGNVPFPLERDQNLADVPDKAAARLNLDVYNRPDIAYGFCASGMIGYFARSSAPTYWLKANGAAISRTTYANLFSVIGTMFGAGDGVNTFNLPDLRGEFIRGWDDGRGIDPGRALGGTQAGSIVSHSHTASSDLQGAHSHGGSTTAAGVHAHGGYTSLLGAHSHAMNAAPDHTHLINGVGDHQHAVQPYAGTGQFSNGHVNSSVNNAGDGSFTGAAGAHTHTMQPAGAYAPTMNAAGDHQHTITTDSQGSHAHSITTDTSPTHAHNITVNAAGSAETRPRNMALLACIRY